MAAIQETVAKKVPFTSDALGVATVSLTEPGVSLPGAERVYLSVSTSLSWRANPVSVTIAELSGVSDAESTEDAIEQTLTVLARAAASTRAASTHSAEGQAGIEGRLHYDGGAFYLNETTITQLMLAAVDDEKNALARDLIEPPLTATLDRVVYTLSDDVQQRAARYIIKDIAAVEAGLQLTLGLPE